MRKTPAKTAAKTAKPEAPRPAARPPAAAKAASPARPPAAPGKPATKPAPKPANAAVNDNANKTPSKSPKATVKPTPDNEPQPSAAPEPRTEPVVEPAKPPRAKSSASSRAASRYATPMPTAPLPPPTSRFADRFAPPRPPTRQMNNLTEDAPRVAHKADPKLANAWKTKTGRDLTEPELMAMPEAEYMNDKQLDFFRARLQALKDDLLSNAGETTEHLREDTSIVPDPADRATIEEEHALELRTRDRERKLLKKISQSLARIEAGDYGFCDETGEPIGLGRLIARPTATLSLEAQQRRELTQKMFGD